MFPSSPRALLLAPLAIGSAVVGCSYDFDAAFDGSGDASTVPDVHADAAEAARPDSNTPDVLDSGGDADAATDVATDAADAHEASTLQDASCGIAQKSCNGTCVSLDDPAYGCTPDGCLPCASGDPHAELACAQGGCFLGACESGWEDCDQDVSNGCETDTANSMSDCGGCGDVCSLAHATSACQDSACGIVSCQSGYADCNNNAADGCEADLDSAATCGSCLTACESPPNATAQCSGAKCDFLCHADYANCNGDIGDGCEANLSSDPDNCETCGNSCPTPTAPHLKRVCDFWFGCTAVCETGWANCDNDWTNGCECAT